VSRPGTARRSIRQVDAIMGMGWRASPRLMVLCAVVGMVSAVASIGYPLGFAHIVDGATTHDGTEVTVAVVFVAVTFALGWCLRLVSTLMGSRLTDYCNLYLGERIGGLVNEAPFLDHFEDPELLAEIDGSRDNRRTLAGAPRQVFSLMQLAVQVVGIVVLLALVYPPVLVVPFLAVAPGLASRRASRVQKASDDVLAGDRRLLGELFNLASGASSARELRTFGVTGAVLERHATLGDRINRQAMRAARRAAAWEAAGWIVYAIGFVAAIVALVLRAAHGHTSPGAVVEAVSLIRRAQRQVAGATDTAGSFATANRTAARLLRLEDYVAAVTPTPSNAAAVPSRLEDGIALKGVSFSYPGRSGGAARRVLDDVDLRIPAGTTVAVVGENGAGKTTLIKLLTGMYRPTDGVITVDGVDLAAMSPTDWRAATTAAFQDYVAFEMKLGQGVGIGDLPRMDDLDGVQTALAGADATELSESLPDGLDTVVGRYIGGRSLSGGQWQRLALWPT
jgi:ATP-binding cassette, subfamily B, bacterial